MKRKASEAMEYFAAATQHQHANTYKALPPALLAASTPPSHSTPPAGPSTSSIPSFLSELLPSSALLSAFHSKLHNKHLQLAAAQPSSATSMPAAAADFTARSALNTQRTKPGKKGARARRSSRRAGRLTAKQRKQLQLLPLPPPQPQPLLQSTATTATDTASISTPVTICAPVLRYASFLPLHALWSSYMADLLSQPASAVPLSLGERLLRADYHGAKVTVARSRAASCVHLAGIVIQESASGWRIIGEDDKVRLVRKEGTVLQLNVSSDWQVELYGDQLAVRSAERSVKKWKNKSSIQIM